MRLSTNEAGLTRRYGKEIELTLDPSHDCLCTNAIVEYATSTMRHVLLGRSSPCCINTFCDDMEDCRWSDTCRTSLHYRVRALQFIDWHRHLLQLRFIERFVKYLAEIVRQSIDGWIRRMHLAYREYSSDQFAMYHLSSRFFSLLIRTRSSAELGYTLSAVTTVEALSHISLFLDRCAHLRWRHVDTPVGCIV